MRLAHSFRSSRRKEIKAQTHQRKLRLQKRQVSSQPVKALGRERLDAHTERLTFASVENKYYQIQTIPGKGYGCIAIRDLQRGTRILEDSPLLIVPIAHYLQSD